MIIAALNWYNLIASYEFWHSSGANFTDLQFLHLLVIQCKIKYPFMSFGTWQEVTKKLRNEMWKLFIFFVGTIKRSHKNTKFTKTQILLFLRAKLQKKKRWRDNIIKKLSDKFLYLSTVHVTTNVSVPITGWNNKLFPASHYLCNFTLMKTIIICCRCFKWQFRKNSLPNFQIIFFWRAEYIYLSNILCCEISLLQTCKFCFSQVYFLTFHTLSSP